MAINFFWLLHNIYMLQAVDLTHFLIFVFSNRTSVRVTNCIRVQRNFTGTVLLQVCDKVLCDSLCTESKYGR